MQPSALRLAALRPTVARSFQQSARRNFVGDGSKSAHPQPKTDGRSAYEEFTDRWFAMEVLPIWAIIAGAFGGAGWYLTRLARSPDVVWDMKNNPRPWEHVKENQQVKLHAVNHVYTGEPWKRDRL